MYDPAFYFTPHKMQLNDILRFFHGDGAAMKFEAGNKIGGHYCCVGCEAYSSCFDDLWPTAFVHVVPY